VCWIGKTRKGFNYKTKAGRLSDRHRPALLRGVFYFAEDPPVQGEYSGGFHSEFLGPKRVGASIKNQGAIFPKASTEAAAFLSAERLQRMRYPGDLPFTSAGERSVRIAS
jgi:hypothetical protein